MKSYYLLLVLLLSGWFVPALSAQDMTPRISQLESRIDELERKTRPNNIEMGGSVFLFGAFCALWAQNTGRSSWLWFFLGLFFSVITIFFLLTKNANDIGRRQRREAFRR